METAETVHRPDAAGTLTCTCATQPFMSVAEAAAIIGRSKEYLYAGLRAGRLPGRKFGRSREIHRAFVQGFVAEVMNLGLPVSFEEYAARWIAKAALGC